MSDRTVIQYEKMNNIFVLKKDGLYRKKGGKIQKVVVKISKKNGLVTAPISPGHLVEYKRIVYILHYKVNLDMDTQIVNIDGDKLNNQPNNLKAIYPKKKQPKEGKTTTNTMKQQPKAVIADEDCEWFNNDDLSNLKREVQASFEEQIKLQNENYIKITLEDGTIHIIGTKTKVVKIEEKSGKLFV